jgi:Ca2+-binding RTX toxin-like protein
VPNYIFGTPGNDTFIGTDPGDPLNPDGIDTFYGVDGSDTLNGLGGDDILDGGTGDDTLDGGAGADQIFGGSGTDTATYALLATGVTASIASGTSSDGDQLYAVENLTGSAFDDLLIGDPYRNFLDGGAGDDQFWSHGGFDVIDGGAGVDTVYYFASAPMQVNLATGLSTGGDAQGNVLSNVENIIGANANDTLTGDAGANYFDGRGGADVLDGGAGDDLLDGGAGGTDSDRLDGGAGDDVLVGRGGADVIDGGAGDDTAYYDTSASGVTVNLTSGLGSGGEAQGDVLSNVENLHGSNVKDTLIGNAGANSLDGAGGDDNLRGGAGADVLDGGNGLDFANYQGSAEAVVVNLLTGMGSGGDAAGDTLSSIENLYGSSHDDQLTGSNARNIIGGELGDDTIVGNGGDDSLSGEAGNDALSGGDGVDRLVGGDGVDTIHGGTGNDSVDAGSQNDQVFGEAGNDNILAGNGNDQLDGGDGDDTLEGAAGSDTLTGGIGIDTASYAGSAAGVSVDLATGAMSGGDAAGDTLSGIEQVLGSGLADTLAGDAEANTLWGMAGDDVLTGGGNGDALKGGVGADCFVYTALSDSAVSGLGKDAIRDFSAGDRIDLSAIDADGNSSNGDTAFSFGTGDYTRQAGELRVVTAGSIQVVYVDVNGDKVSDLAINVTSDHALTAGDFVL